MRLTLTNKGRKESTKWEKLICISHSKIRMNNDGWQCHLDRVGVDHGRRFMKEPVLLHGKNCHAVFCRRQTHQSVLENQEEIKDCIDDPIIYVLEIVLINILNKSNRTWHRFKVQSHCSRDPFRPGTGAISQTKWRENTAYVGWLEVENEKKTLLTRSMTRRISST